MGEAMHVVGAEGIWETSVPSTWFCHEPKLLFKIKSRDFPGGAVFKNPPANAGDTGSIPGPGRSHMPRN